MNISPVLGTGDDDNLVGTGRSEVISGAAGDDTIQGLSGNDEVFGGSGNDVLLGQGGNDTIYGNGKPAYVDMANLTIENETTATVTFVDEGAGFRNALGVYEIGEDGSISNVQILFANASKEGSGGDLKPGESQVTFDVSGGAQLGFFIVSNGYGKGPLNREALSSASGSFELRELDGSSGSTDSSALELWWIDEVTGEEIHIKSQYGYSTFHSIGTEHNSFAPNPDAFDHVVGRANTVTGQLLIGFEDLYAGGDKDYDDTVILIDIGQDNVVALLPPPSAGSGLPDDDIIYGGDGDDKLFGVGGDDVLHGGNGNDTVMGNSGDDQLFGNAGEDHLTGNSGNDRISGGSGNDELFGSSGNDWLAGDDGDDYLQGGSGDDDLLGGIGDDIMDGNSGNDVLFGGSGDDTLNGNSGDDFLAGDSGNDSLNGHSGADYLLGGGGQDRVVGGSGDDFVSGGENNDKVYGGSGDDLVYGDEGNDYLSAGTGDDYVIGGCGDDKLIGGAGADVFVFDLSKDGSAGRDVIYDFTSDDSLLFTGGLFDNFSEIMDVCSQVGNDVRIDFAEAGMLTIRNFELDSLTVEMFDFSV